MVVGVVISQMIFLYDMSLIYIATVVWNFGRTQIARRSLTDGNNCGLITDHYTDDPNG
jgi:hypothetical protein